MDWIKKNFIRPHKNIKSWLEYAGGRDLNKTAEFWRPSWNCLYIVHCYVWCLNAYDQKNSITTVKHRGGTPMMWRFFCSWNWYSWSCMYGDMMDSQKHQTTLKRNVMPSLDKWNLGDRWTLDPKDTFMSTKAWLRKGSWYVLESHQILSVIRFKCSMLV